MTQRHIYYVSIHAPGCLPDAPGTYYGDEEEATKEYEQLTHELANEFYIATMTDVSISDIKHIIPDIPQEPQGIADYLNDKYGH